MKCAEDIKTYSKGKSEQKLFHFLHGMDPTHQNILRATSNESKGIATRLIVGSGETEGVGLAIKGYRRNDGKKPFIKEDKSHLTCEEYGTTTVIKHCRHLHGPPLPRSSWTTTAAIHYRVNSVSMN
nr:hypothetical protein [Tanacetum cinerariifolium]